MGRISSPHYKGNMFDHGADAEHFQGVGPELHAPTFWVLLAKLGPGWSMAQ